ncbi:MAG: glycosyltransferase family 39 protein [Myxococcota bacterium]
MCTSEENLEQVDPEFEHLSRAASQAGELKESADAEQDSDFAQKPNRLAAAGCAVSGFTAALLMMSNEAQLPRGPFYGSLLTFIGVLGCVGLLPRSGFRHRGKAGPTSSPGPAVSCRTWTAPSIDWWRSEQAESAGSASESAAPPLREAWFLTPKWTVLTAVLVLLLGIVSMGYDAATPSIIASLMVLSLSAIHRPALLVFVVVSLVYAPFLGTYGLWDPWETHYGEVAREILSRDDWISLWWAQDGWFWSKPILIFWSEAFAMASLGVDASPDAHPLHPEWALRLPFYLFSVGAVLSAYAAVRRVFGVRAGVLSALVLATAPHYFLLAHQAITDMLLVANMTLAMSMLTLAVVTPEDKVEGRVYLGLETEIGVKRKRALSIVLGGVTLLVMATLTFALGLGWIGIAAGLAIGSALTLGTALFGRVELSMRQLVTGIFVMVVVPQALYLVSRNITLVDYWRFALHEDVFLLGSAGNHGIAGNASLGDRRPHVPEFQPALQGLLWLLCLVGIVAQTVRETRARSLFLFCFYFFCALAFMGKGIPGFALPGLVALLWLISSNRWKMMFDGQLHIGTGILMVTTVGLPWFVAMYMRHGPAFTDRLLIHDHINRLAVGVHGDSGSIRYFIEQFGFGTFPWIGLVPFAALFWMSRESEDPSLQIPRKMDFLKLHSIWFFGAFTLFSAMKTKFHHYIFPAVPPAMILVGILLDRLVAGMPKGDPAISRVRWRSPLGFVLAALSPLPLVLGVAGFFGDVRGFIPGPMSERSDVSESGSEAATRLGSVTEQAVAQTASSAALETDWVLNHPWPTPLAAGLLMFGLVLLGLSGCLLAPRPFARLRPFVGSVSVSEGASSVIKSGGDSKPVSIALCVMFAAAATLVAFVGRDLSWEIATRPHGYERLIHLFVYKYDRPWPEQWDYRPILTGFALVSTAILSMGAVRRLHVLLVPTLLGVALSFSVWTLNYYITDLSPHWGQRELVQRYYELRDSANESLVAWQMNWKGENFYSGNHVHVFVDLDNKKVRQWMDERSGEKAFFLLEHTRMSSFKNLMRSRQYRAVTTKRDCNKFVLMEVHL